MKYVNFANRETNIEKYSVALPPEMENATEEEIKEWLKDSEDFTYMQFMETEESELAFDKCFEIEEY